MSAPAPHSSPRLSRVAVLLLAAAVLLLVTLPKLVTEDSTARFEALDGLLRSGTRSDVKYSLIGPLFAAPLWVTAATDGEKTAVWQFNRVVLVAGAVGLWWALRRVLSGEHRFRFLLLLAFASVAPYHAMFFGGEPFTVVCVGVGTAAAVVRRAWWGWPLAALGAANIPATIVGLAAAAGVACWHHRRLRYVSAVAAAAALVLAENGLRRGHPLAGGYAGEHGFVTILPYSGLPGFSYPFVLGLLSILLSFGKGLIFFVPGLFVPLDRRADADTDREADLRLLYRMWVGFVVGLALVYAKWWAWYGGVFFGPRFFLFAALPAALVLARRSAPPFDPRPAVNAVVLGVLLLSCWVGASGVVFRESGPAEILGETFALEFVIWYVPEFSPLWRPFVGPHPLGAMDLARLIVFALAAVYLAGPLAVSVSRQAVATLRRAWMAYRTGPRFRF
jgi:hypothetical protein